jgi:hypothetical protein
MLLLLLLLLLLTLLLLTLLLLVLLMHDAEPLLVIDLHQVSQAQRNELSFLLMWQHEAAQLSRQPRISTGSAGSTASSSAAGSKVMVQTKLSFRTAATASVQALVHSVDKASTQPFMDYTDRRGCSLVKHPAKLLRKAYIQAAGVRVELQV